MTRLAPLLGRRAVIAGIGSVLAAPAMAKEPPREIIAAMDFDEIWRTLDERYCFFHLKATDWAKARRLYRPMAIAAPDQAAFTEVIRQLLGELYDPHTHVNNLPNGSPRTPPFDIWAEWRDGKATVFDVREGSHAQTGGLRPGDQVLSIGQGRIELTAAAYRPKCLKHPDPEAEDYALRASLAGFIAQDRTLEVSRAGRPQTLTLKAIPSPGEPSVAWKRMEDGFGYIRISSFGDNMAVDLFDQALTDLRESNGLILDARRNGGGDTAIARPMMARLIGTRTRYAYMRRREGRGLSAPWQEFVDPRGPFTYTGPSWSSPTAGAPAWPRDSPWACRAWAAPAWSARQ
jgi:carboxyl-terminal processing protease